MEKIKRDGHIHSPFCRHGSKDSFEAYIEEAIRLGRGEISFTEHFPLPYGIASKKFIEECSLLEEEVPVYLAAVKAQQEKYKGRIKINRGFEVDYLEGKEEETGRMLDRFGSEIEDSILSVHFVLYQEKYYAIDCSEWFEELLGKMGSLQAVYDLYFTTLIKAVKSEMGVYKPKRTGHPSLIRIFNQKYPFDYDDHGLYEELLTEMKERSLEIDFNSAGLRKMYCKESYPSGRLLELALQKGVPLVTGSDAHEAAHMAVLDQLED